MILQRRDNEVRKINVPDHKFVSLQLSYHLDDIDQIKNMLSEKEIYSITGEKKERGLRNIWQMSHTRYRTHAYNCTFNGNVAGYINCKEISPDEVRIQVLMVHPALRLKGIARDLLTHVTYFNRMVDVSMEVFGELNERFELLLKSLGFQVISRDDAKNSRIFYKKAIYKN